MQHPVSPRLIRGLVTVCIAGVLLWLLSVMLGPGWTVGPAPPEEGRRALFLHSDSTAPAGEAVGERREETIVSGQQPAPPETDAASATPVGRAGLIIPVEGIRPDELVDTYNEARGQGRVHNAIDIMAPRGTPVLAAADGRILRLFYSEGGGHTLYQLGTDGRTVYYYAHLDRYADGLAEDHFARQGEVIGYVGDTGNAVPGNHHLHFAIWTVEDPSDFWDGAAINPYPLLRGE